MTYQHNNREPIVLANDPIDPDSTDWVFFIYEDWLRTGESISSHEGVIENGTIVTDSQVIGSMDDEAGVTHTNVYGIKVSPTAGVTEMTVTHRVTTTTTGSPDLGRTNIDHSAILCVAET